jgi:hypothetical protein
MILGFKTHFPDGELTYLEEQIIDGTKIHSLREDPKGRWRKGRSIQMATGVRSKQYEQFNKGLERLETCTGIQHCSMTYHADEVLKILVDDRSLMPHEIQDLIKNDGLTRKHFVEWFFPKKNQEWSGKIIHWTNFRY